MCTEKKKFRANSAFPALPSRVNYTASKKYVVAGGFTSAVMHLRACTRFSAPPFSFLPFVGGLSKQLETPFGITFPIVAPGKNLDGTEFSIINELFNTNDKSHLALNY